MGRGEMGRGEMGIDWVRNGKGRSGKGRNGNKPLGSPAWLRACAHTSVMSSQRGQGGHAPPFESWGP